MASNTFVKIATVTVGSGGASSIDFSSIPATYTDLCLMVSARDTNSPGNPDDGLFISLNGSTTGYSNKVVYGNGSTAASGSNSYDITTKTYVGAIDTASATASTFSNISIYIPNYTSSNAKSISSDSVLENNATAVITALNASLWTGTSAITSLSLTLNTYTFAQYSTATLYGIRSS